MGAVAISPAGTETTERCTARDRRMASRGTTVTAPAIPWFT
jgi:hypothetical protein